MTKLRSAFSAAGSRTRKRPISGPAFVILGLVLAGIWYGSRVLGQTATVSVDTVTKPATPAVETSTPPVQSADQAAKPSQTSPPQATAPAPTAAPATGLPAGYPSAIPAPTGGTLTKATVAGKSGDQTFVASYHLVGSPSAVSTAYQQQLTTAGLTVHAVLGSADSAFFGAEKDSLSISVSVGADASANGTSNLTITTSGS